jgi:hypothetical protein
MNVRQVIVLDPMLLQSTISSRPSPARTAFVMIPA